MSSDKPRNAVSSRVMDLHRLIAAPLLATVDADSLAARRYLDSLCSVAFESYDRQTGRTGPLRMLRFCYLSNDVSGCRKRQVAVPLLSLVPLPLLHVQEAVFDFDIHILDAVSNRREERFSFKEGKEVAPADDDPDDGLCMRASLAPQHGGGREASAQHGLTANMKVHVKMGQAGMPGGLAKLLNLAAADAVGEEPNG
ncbi:DUF2589 domain-containing protein [uncultured Rikenella sp.]|uniref:DUF2589 domain-containing protein n=1 Tax=uncultured Rikenella sp. TaxID=368003 RepID=UPI0026209F56|nr:DUF2589 domain-containing protein [uncultured Rikenella sp.]